ncbi:MAG: cytochrome P450 [Chloroflexi bacterium]|nr:cytochrome P450 [Chloroflexota bacterium]
MLNIAEELLLLLMDEDRGEYTAVPERTLGYALTGATLIELELRHRIDVSPEALVVIDPTPVDDDLLDPVLADIVAVSRDTTHNAEFWVRRIAQSSDELRGRALAGLAAQGMVEADESGFFFLSRRAARARHYAPTQSQQAEETRQRILQAIFSDNIPDTRDIVIISLAHACDIFQRILPTDEYEEARERIEIISRLEMISRSVTDGIRNLTLAEAYARRRGIQQKGGGWPRASGHLPIIGHVLQFRKTINGFLTEQYRNLGPVFEVSLLGKKWLVLAGPEANRFLMREGRDCLHNDHVAWQGFAQQFGGTRALAGMDGPEHVRLRRLMRDGYSRGQLVKDLPQAVAIIENEMRQWPENRPVSVYPSVQRMVVDQLGTLMSGISPKEHMEDILTFIHALEMVYLARMYPRFMAHTPKVRRARRRIEELFERVLAAHEPALRTEEIPNLSDSLIEMRRLAPDFITDKNLFVDSMGPFMAGADTASSATSFMLYSLLKHPDTLEQVREEADQLFAQDAPTAAGVNNMPVTQRAIQETLRLHTIVPVMVRTVANSFEFAGYWIPAGTSVWVAMPVSHHLPELYPNPERFDIDRFLPERREHGQPGAYTPFGFGPHSCLGQGAAQAQMTLIIATILHRAEIVLDPPDYQMKLDSIPVPSPNRSFKIRLTRWRQKGG